MSSVFVKQPRFFSFPCISFCGLVQVVYVYIAIFFSGTLKEFTLFVFTCSKTLAEVFVRVFLDAALAIVIFWFHIQVLLLLIFSESTVIWSIYVSLRGSERKGWGGKEKGRGLDIVACFRLLLENAKTDAINARQLGRKRAQDQFKCRTFHEPNLIAIWLDSNDKSSMVDSDVELDSLLRCTIFYNVYH